MFINSKHTCKFVEIVSGSREGAFWEKNDFSGIFVKMWVQPLHIPMQPPIEKFGF